MQSPFTQQTKYSLCQLMVRALLVCSVFLLQIISPCVCLGECCKSCSVITCGPCAAIGSATKLQSTSLSSCQAGCCGIQNTACNTECNNTQTDGDKAVSASSCCDCGECVCQSLPSRLFHVGQSEPEIPSDSFDACLTLLSPIYELVPTSSYVQTLQPLSDAKSSLRLHAILSVWLN